MKVVQVTNIGMQATVEQISTLFSFLGTIEDLKLYPENQLLNPDDLKCAFVKFASEEDAGVALHLNNTVFIDRALVLEPHDTDDLPSEVEGLRIGASAPRVDAESRFPRWPPNVTNQIVGAGPGAVIHTHDPKFSVLNLPPYPTLPASTDPSKIDEIRRTLYAGNLDAFVTAEQLMQFFSQAGEIMYVRMAGDQTQPTRFAFIEFSHQSSIAAALSFNGMMFMGRALKVNHSNIAIIKPQQHSLSTAPKNIDEVMRRVKEADKLISAAIDPSAATSGANVFQRKLFGLSGDGKKRSRSPISRRRRSRSRSRGRRRRSRSKSRGRRSRSKARRSRSPRKKSRDRSKRSRSKDKRRDSKRSRSRDRSDRKKRSRSRRRSKDKSDRSKRSKSRSKRSRSRKRSRSKDKGKDRSKRSSSRDRKKRSHRSKSRSPRKSSSSSKRDRSRDRKSSPKKESSTKDRTKESTRENTKESTKESTRDRTKESTPPKKSPVKEESPVDEPTGNGVTSPGRTSPGVTSPVKSEHAGSTPPLDRAEQDLMNAVITSEGLDN